MKSKIALRGGSYSLIITAVVMAILVAVNVFVNVLPATWTKLDISSSQLYSITSNTKVVVNNLQKDVTIYWIVQSDMEDTILENLLGKYESLSDHIDVVKKNPDVFPTFTEQYTTEEVPNNSLIVECGERFRYISNEDIYEYEIDYYNYQAYAEAFDGEGAITSAIDYVISEDLPVLYLLEGHGEADLPAEFREQVEKENIETQQLSLLSLESIPEDADCVMIYAPASDLSEEEAKMLSAHVQDGCKVLVISGPLEDVILTNLNSLMSSYGVEVAEGIVVEGDQDAYIYGYPYMLLPDMNSHAITDPLIENRYHPLMSVASGLMVADGTGSGQVTQLLTTSELSFSKAAGYALSTYEQEEGDIDGPFALAVAIEDLVNDGQLVWFTSNEFLEASVNSYSSGANGDLVMNALSSLIGETEAVSIRSKSLNYNYLTISEETSSFLKVLMIGIIPLTYLGVGITVILIKRRQQNETV